MIILLAHQITKNTSLLKADLAAKTNLIIFLDKKPLIANIHNMLYLLSLFLLTTPPKSIKRKTPQKPYSPPTKAEKVISLRQYHTKEILPLGNPSKKMVNLFFRCRMTGKTTRMDPKLIKVLRDTSLHFDAREIIIISAFRAPRYNEELRKKLHEVALRSKHLFGKAVDFALKGVDTAKVARYLRKKRIGGVGYYNRSKFVHFDTGPVRTWNGL